MAKETDGVARSVWLTPEMDALIEKARNRLGYSRSGFFKYAVARLLQELSLLSEQVHLEEG